MALQRIFWGGMVFFSVQMVIQPCHAVLGEPADSVESDQRSLGGRQIAKTAVNGYQVDEIQSDATTVREYISPEGIVFAIAWNGLVHPDLTPLLGKFASEYEQALKQVSRKPGRRSLQVIGNGVVVEKWGHMRNLQGRAYAPHLLPPGVTIDAIK